MAAIDLIFEKDYGTGFAPVAPPLNWKATQLEALFTSRHPSASVRAINFEWVGKNAEDLLKYRNGGLNGTTPGIFEGTGLRIKTCGNTIFNGCDELTEAQWECDKVIAPSRESGRIEWFMESADGFNFAYLKSIGIIQNGDYKWTPYCITTIPNWNAVMLASLGIFVCVKEIIETVKRIIYLIEDLIADIAAFIAGNYTTFGSFILSLIAKILEIIFYAYYLYTVIRALANFVKDFFDNIIQPKKWKLGMTVRDLMIRGCQYLNLTFSSTIFNDPASVYYNTTIMPPKIVRPINPTLVNFFHRPANEENLNNIMYGYYDGTFGQLIRDLMLTFNVEPTIINNVCHLEEVHHWNNINPYQIPDTDEVGNTFNLPDPHGTNANELASYYQLLYQIDELDENTINRYNGTSCSVKLEPITTTNNKNWLFKNADIKNFPFAHARRKEVLNNVEQFFNLMLIKAQKILDSDFFNLLFDIDAFLTQANSALPSGVVVFHHPSYVLAHQQSNDLLSVQAQLNAMSPATNTRVGWLELSSDNTSVHKIFIGRPQSNTFNPPSDPASGGIDWQIEPTSEVNMSALILMKNFHKFNLATRGNQYHTYKERKIKFCCSDWSIIKNNNILKTPDNKNGKFEKVLWDIHNETATVDYRIQQNYTMNLREQLSIDGEQAIIQSSTPLNPLIN